MEIKLKRSGNMDESILISIKKLLGIAEDYNYFDQDIIMHINAALMILTQLGVGPSKGFLITDDAATWNDFINNTDNLGSIQSYVYMKVKLMFDPPQNSFTVDSMTKLVNELEWRLNVAADNSGEEVK
jgi:hypothetical protein